MSRSSDSFQAVFVWFPGPGDRAARSPPVNSGKMSLRAPCVHQRRHGVLRRAASIAVVAIGACTAASSLLIGFLNTSRSAGGQGVGRLRTNIARKQAISEDAQNLLLDLTVDKIKSELVELGMSTAGTDQELAERLVQAEAAWDEARASVDSYDTNAIPPGSTTMSIGKKKGETFEHILETDPDYCDWVLGSVEKDEENSSEIFRSFAKYIRSTHPFDASARVAEKFPTQGPPDGDATISFGKYKGRTFEEVAVEDPDYCSWVIDQVENPGSDTSTILEQFARYLMHRNGAQPLSDPVPPQQEIIQFGKYKGRAFEEVAVEDPDYCSWVVRQLNKSGGDPPGRALTKFAMYLVERSKTQPLAVSVPGPQNLVEFGKYRGQRYDEVLESDPRYCCWVLSQAAENDSYLRLKQFAEYIKEVRPDLSPVDHS